ncbi:ATP-dependent DNA ligase [bacterium]|jgi:DNA ligase-1|nr:ATP-dependent DNA ligase [bacterium]
MNSWNIIQQLEADNSSLAKQAIIKANISNTEFVAGATMCLDPLVTFGVKQVPISEVDGSGLDWSAFEILANALMNRDLTGHAARDAIIGAMEMATIEQWNDWYRRILIKDLRCGTGAKLINKVQKDTIPVFGCMLAHDGAKHPKKIEGKCYIEYKYDGVRVIAIVTNGDATLYSRNGKLLENFPHINEALSKPEFEGLVFDGEVMSEDFQALMKQVQRKEGAQTEDCYLAVFDMLTLEEFNASGTDLSAKERRERLERLEGSLNHRIQLVDAQLINLDTDEGQTQFQAMNKQALAEGYEGLMIKPAHMGYKCSRSHAWLKIKPFIEVTLTVVALEEGTGKNAGMLGALVVEGNDDGKNFHLNVGSGLTDDMRKDIWAVQESVIGQLVEIRADAATQSQDAGDIWSLRFPRFKTFRGFAIGEKL